MVILSGPNMSGYNKGVTGPLGNMLVVYRSQGLSEKEIALRLLCKTTKIIEGKKGLGECDKKRRKR